MAKTSGDASLYDDVGGKVDDQLAKRPLIISEAHHQHRTTVATTCHDCGGEIEIGSLHSAQEVRVTHGVRSQLTTALSHPECFEIAQRVQVIVGMENIVRWQVGRMPLSAVWGRMGAQIAKADPELAYQLAEAFGSPS